MTFLSIAFAPVHPLPLTRSTGPPRAQPVRRRPRVATATLSPPRPTVAPPATAPAPSTSPSSTPSPSLPGERRPRGSQGRVTVEGDTLETAPHHVVLVAAHAALAALTAAQTASATTSAWGSVPHVGAAMAAYALADLFVGIYHHALDNYGSGNTPLFGFQIAAFQGHHSFPWTIAARTAPNNMHRLALAAAPLQLLLLVLAPASSPVRTLCAALVSFSVLSQETHRQAHKKRPAAWVRALQNTGLIIGPVSHAKHHRVPHADNYCIVSGWWNPLLDSSGFFRMWEGVLFAATGAQALDWKLDPELKAQALDRLPVPLREVARRRDETQ